MAQLDMFGGLIASAPAPRAVAPALAAPAPFVTAPGPAPPAVATDPTPPQTARLGWIAKRPLGWERLLARAPLVPVELLVSTLWTGQVIETLCYPGLGTYHLFRDGVFAEIQAGSDRALRCVLLTRADAAALHGRHPFVHVCQAGTRAARFRFPLVGEVPGTGALDVLAMLQDPS